MDHTLPITRRILSPTDLSQFLRLERCERYLRLRMYERENGRGFLHDFDVAPEEIPPILGRSGNTFEKRVVSDLTQHFPLQDFSASAIKDGALRLPDNQRFASLAQALPPGEMLLVAQPRLQLPLGGFSIRGDADLVLLSRDSSSGALSILVIDIKSTTSVKVEHRLQVAFYALLIQQLLKDDAAATLEIAILYRGPAQGGTSEMTDELCRDRAAMQQVFGLGHGFLERIPDLDTYTAEVEALVSGNNPLAERVATKDARDLVFSLGLKCDGCLVNQYCMKKAHVDDDLSLIPYLTARDKKALRRSGVHTVRDLASVKELTEEKELVPAEGAETTLRALAATSVGPRIDELILRARKKAAVPTLSYIPNKGHSTIPASTPELHPNLIRVYVEAQHDFVQDRVYLLGALVVANAEGVPVRRQHVVHLSDGPPDTPEKEAALFAAWIKETLEAVVTLAEGNEAPIHILFWNDFGQKALLEALARNLPPMVDAAPALYDFVTQIAAFDSPVVTFLSDEIRQHKNYSPTCPSLPLIASHLRFDWTDAETGDLYTRLFRPHLFDNRGQLEDGTYYARRSRHNSQIPLEYVYAAWDELPAVPAKGQDPYRLYREVMTEQIEGFTRKRLDAIEHIASDLRPSEIIRKASFTLPDLSEYSGRASHLAEAIREFLTIERHTYLANWRSTRNMAPERRAVAGATLLMSYQDADQPDGGAHMRECQERERQYQEWRQANPGKRRDKAAMAATKWSLAGDSIYLRVETTGTDADLDTILGMMTVKDGERVVCSSRWTDYGREGQPYTPTAKQLLYGMRVTLERMLIERDEEGRAIAAKAVVTSCGTMGGAGKDGYLFGYNESPFADGTLYTLDEDPSDVMGSRMKGLANLLCQKEEDGEPEAHAFYHRVSREDLTTPANWPDGAVEGQARFLEGLKALHEAGIAFDFEPSKQEYIGSHGGDPLLLVQGPPGTGKSFSTGFAVLARLQGAMAAGIRQRVFLSCKTHSATDVLLSGVSGAQEQLAKWQQQAPDIFKQFFDARLLGVPLFRLGKDRDGDDSPDEDYICVAGTPNALYKLAPKDHPFGSERCDLLVLDEASQMSLPEALLASTPLSSDGRVIVVGDPRQMPPIVQHAWEDEPRRTFQMYPTYLSLFDFLLTLNPPLIQFEESFRLHQVMADFLRNEIYQHDGIAYRSQKTKVLEALTHDNPLVAAALAPDFPLVVVVHDEAESQTRNAFEEKLLGPILSALTDAHGLDAREGFGVVVPHRAQRIALRMAHPQLTVLDDAGQVVLAAVDTVERYQGDEREVVIISATESDPDYIQASAGFLLDPRRLTVALSRAKRKMILVASRSIFEYASINDEVFKNSQIWKNLLRRACKTELYRSDVEGREVIVYGCPVTVGE